MNAREKLIVKYVSDLKEKCGMTPDMELLKKSDCWVWPIHL